MKTKLLSLLLALLLGASAAMVSCGNSGSAVETAGETKAPVETVSDNGGETEEPEEETAEETSDETSDETTGVQFTLHDAVGKPGGTVEVEVDISTSVKINSVALYELTYDKDILTFKGFSDWQTFEDNRCVIPGGIDEEKQAIVLAMKDISSLDETICRVVFEINPNAKEGTVSVDMNSLVKLYSEVIESSVDGAEITIQK